MQDNMNVELTIKKDIEDIKKIFDTYGVRVFLVYGALLGLYRDGKLLPEDDDIDLCVIDKIDFRTRKDIGWALYSLGFMPQIITFNVYGRLEQAEMGYNGDAETGIIVCQRNIKFTIFFFKEVSCETHTSEYLCIPKLGAAKLISIPVEYFKKNDTIKIGKIKFLTPSPIKKYLEFSYEDWKDKSKRDHSPTWYDAHNESLYVEIMRNTQ